MIKDKGGNGLADKGLPHGQAIDEDELIVKKPVMLDFIAHILDVYNNRRLAEHGVTHSQAKILVRIYHSKDKRIAQSELKKFGRQGSTITSLLANLEKGGFIRRSSSKTDARAKYVELTESGAFIAMLAFGNIRELEERIDSFLTKDEAAQLQGLLEKVSHGLHDTLCNNNERNDNT